METGGSVNETSRRPLIISLLAVFAAAILISWLFFRGQAVAPDGSGISSFEECIDAGHPVMESYPRQCRANGQTFTEDIN